MTFTWRRAALLAALVFLALFFVRYATSGPNENVDNLGFDQSLNAQSESFELTRKNYASAKSQLTAVAPLPPGSPQNEKYEKIGTLAQVTKDFDADRKRVSDLIAANSAVLQSERAVGLTGRRALQLGIGVPPEKFDALIEAARTIGKSVAVEIVKNDKTNEYLQLKARRQTLEKARAALEDMRGGGGSISDRVGVQNRITEIEQQIQDLGVSLGEFDTQNELCTVKLSLREAQTPKPWSVRHRAWTAFQRALNDYLMLGLGFFGLMFGLWLAALAGRKAQEMWTAGGV